MKTMTIRNQPPKPAAAIEPEKRRRGPSLNRTLLSLMQEAPDLSNRRRRGNGLRRMSGSWSEDEYRNFETHVAAFEEIDRDLWK